MKRLECLEWEVNRRLRVRRRVGVDKEARRDGGMVLSGRVRMSREGVVVAGVSGWSVVAVVVVVVVVVVGKDETSC